MDRAEQMFVKIAGPANFLGKMYTKAVAGTKSLAKETAALKQNVFALVGGEKVRRAASKLPQADLFKNWTAADLAALKELRKKVGKGLIIPGLGATGIGGAGYMAGKSRD